MKRTRFGAVAFLAQVIAVLAFSTGLRADDAVPSDRLLPPEVLAYVTIPSVTEVKARMQEVVDEVKGNRELADVRRDVEGQLSELGGLVEKNLGVTVDDLLDLPSGELSLAMVQVRGMKLAMVGFLDYGESGETLDALLEKAADSLKDEGAQQTSEEIDDTRITVFTLPREDDAPANAQTRRLAYFKKDSQFVFTFGFGEPLDALGPVLARWDGEHPQTFANNESYRYIVERCKTNGQTKPLLTWYLNPLAFTQNILREGGQEEMQIQMMMVMLPRLGIDRLKGIGGSLDTSAGDFAAVHRAFVYVDQPATGVFDILRFPVVDTVPPAWVRADVSSYFSVNWDVGGAYRAIGALVDQFMGPGTFTRTVEQLADAQEGPQIHIKRDLIDHLNGRIFVVDDLADPEDPETQRYLVALGLSNQDKMQGTLSSVGRTPGFPGTIREFRGATIYEIPIPAPGAAARTAAATVSNNLLMISNDVTIIEQVIRGDADQTPLAESEDYRRIARHFPSQASLISYERQDSQVKLLWELLRSGDINDDLAEIDLSKLPPFRAIERYLPLTGGYATPDERGALYVSFSIRKAKD
jgi:hypothetical protein